MHRWVSHGSARRMTRDHPNVGSQRYALNTALGSRRDARQAGSTQAAAATRIILAATPATVDTSVGRTPNSSDAISG